MDEDKPFLQRIWGAAWRLAAGDLLLEAIQTYFGIHTLLGVIVGAIAGYLAHTAGMPLFLVLIIFICTFGMITVITDFFMELSGNIRAAKIIFYDLDGKYIRKPPIAYYSKEGDQVIYEFNSFARVVNFGIYSRTLESVYAELKMANDVLDTYVLSGFPLQQRLLSLDSTKVVPVNIKLKADLSSTQMLGINPQKAKISIGVRATGTFFERNVKLRLKNQAKNS